MQADIDEAPPTQFQRPAKKMDEWWFGLKTSELRSLPNLPRNCGSMRGNQASDCCLVPVLRPPVS